VGTLIGTKVLFRPGLRWEHSYDRAAYDGGAAHSQFSFTMDTIFKF